jgi:hypothetical protein
MIELTFAPQLRDHLYCGWLSSLRSWRAWWWLIGLVVAAFIIVYFVTWSLVNALYSAGFIALLGIIYQTLPALNLIIQSTLYRNAPKQVVWRITTQALNIQWGHGQIEQSWSKVTTVREWCNCFVIFTQSGRTHFYYLPKVAFKNNQQEHQFRQILKAKFINF